MILVTGAAGKTGRAIIRALAQRGQPLRVWVRRHAHVEPIRSLAANEIVVGEFLDPSALQSAVRGVRSIYHICPNIHPDEVIIGRAMITAARDAHVRRFVYHSVLHPQTEAMPHHWNKLRVEERLFESGLAFTILQPAPYMQNLLANRDAIMNDGVYRVPYSIDAPFSWIDLEDVAQVAASVLTEDDHAGAIYELAGAQVLTPRQVAGKFAEVLGRDVRAEKIETDEWRSNAGKTGMPPYAIETLTEMFAYYDRFGLWGNPLVLTDLLGRMPTALEEFIQRTFG